jgi:hypothetical protein
MRYSNRLRADFLRKYCKYGGYTEDLVLLSRARQFEEANRLEPVKPRLKKPITGWDDCIAPLKEEPYCFLFDDSIITPEEAAVIKGILGDKDEIREYKKGEEIPLSLYSLSGGRVLPWSYIRVQLTTNILEVILNQNLKAL